ncbi:MAG: tRNA (adenosine(37)-N6)-threonylcarbamoyltransferase complex dimerization subunit type 1 TsaB [Acetobacteraceae bacterium]|nr:tRNA (adenosine(37)-N6)-threonylcarbamoyltransferase complex dimerization subunit type 1 TsaB [Acetobacteraceae bacterium]
MRVLGLDAALGHCSAAVVDDGMLRGSCTVAIRQGQPAALPAVVQAAFDAASMVPSELDLIAVTIGPGSFTGIRSGLAFAHGLAVGLGIPVVGVTVGQALAVAARPGPQRALWSVVDNRRGQIFLERDGQVATVSLQALPQPAGPVAISGDAAIEVAARLAAQGHDVLLTDRRVPTPFDVAMAGKALLRDGGEPGLVRPLYIDAPAVRVQAGGLRTAPVP